MNILILEDEIPAYQKLLSNLDTYFDEKITHHWARTIKDGLVFLNENQYDFILSDIQLLDGVSFDLFNKTEVNCPIIFCSAHDDYLFQAFNTNGIAYILKPYTAKDFTNALDKYQSLFNQKNYASLDATILSTLKEALKEEHTNYKKRFVIKKTKGIQLLQVIDISVIEASGDFCIITDSLGKRHTISQNIGSLAAQLSPKKFFKINRSQILHIDFILNIESHFKNRLLITMQGVKDKMMTSSSITAEFRKWLE